MSLPLRRRLRGLIQEKVPLMMTCREFEDFVADYRDGALSWPRRMVFRLHLVFCRECRDYLASYEQAVALGKAAFPEPDKPVPDQVPDDLVRAILASRRDDR